MTCGSIPPIRTRSGTWHITRPSSCTSTFTGTESRSSSGRSTVPSTSSWERCPRSPPAAEDRRALHQAGGPRVRAALRAAGRRGDRPHGLAGSRVRIPLVRDVEARTPVRQHQARPAPHRATDRSLADTMRRGDRVDRHAAALMRRAAARDRAHTEVPPMQSARAMICGDKRRGVSV